MAAVAPAQTIVQALGNATPRLARTSDSSRADARLLLAHVLGCDREWLLAHGEAYIAASQLHEFAHLCDLRAEGRPLAYLLGFVWFYGRRFAVDERAMVPRPESEHLVDEALAHIGGRAAVLDVGAGSGALACTIAAERDDAFVEATDISMGAIALAEENARRLGVANRCRFHCGSLAAPVGARTFDVVMANLPYLPARDVPPAPNPIAFEPRAALDGGADGLQLYREFLPAVPGLLRPGGLLLLEAAPPVMNGLAQLVTKAFPLGRFEVCSDYAGLARYVKLATAAAG